MFDFLKSRKANLGLVLDIGTEFIKALIFEAKADTAEVLGVARIRQKLTEMRGGTVLDIEGVTKKINQAKTLKIYVCNVMTQPGETDGYKASDHIKAIFEHTNNKLFDYCLVNEKKPKTSLLEKYQKRGSSPVVTDTAEIERLGVKVIRGNFINESDLVRHDSPRLAKAVIKLILEVYPEKGR